VHFGERQRLAVVESWSEGNWFFDQLEPLYREVVRKAYGCQSCRVSEQQYCQRAVSYALDLFAQEIGAEKSKVVHALLTAHNEFAFNINAPSLRSAFKEALL